MKDDLEDFDGSSDSNDTRDVRPSLLLAIAEKKAASDADRALITDLILKRRDYGEITAEALIALREEPPFEPVDRYLSHFGDGEDLDLVHLCCLIRRLAALPDLPAETLRHALADRAARWRSEDGGYAPEPGQAEGTVYHAFMAHAAYEDLGQTVPDLPALLQFVRGRACPDGSFSNAKSLPFGNVPSTAAAVSLLRQHTEPLPSASDSRD